GRGSDGEEVYVLAGAVVDLKGTLDLVPAGRHQRQVGGENTDRRPDAGPDLQPDEGGGRLRELDPDATAVVQVGGAGDVVHVHLQAVSGRDLGRQRPARGAGAIVVEARQRPLAAGVVGDAEAPAHLLAVPHEAHVLLQDA